MPWFVSLSCLLLKHWEACLDRSQHQIWQAAGCASPACSRRAPPWLHCAFPQVHAGGAGPGDAGAGRAEGPGLADIQRQAGLRGRHLRLRHPSDPRQQAVLKGAPRVVTGRGAFWKGPVRDKRFLVV